MKHELFIRLELSSYFYDRTTIRLLYWNDNNIDYLGQRTERAAASGGTEMTIPLVHLHIYTRDGWHAKCKGDHHNTFKFHNLYTYDESKITCIYCLEALVKSRGGTYGDWRRLVDTQCDWRILCPEQQPAESDGK
jgi:hypothetical protein